jgi:lipoprotein-anchoring transpeptidase ErfK/SrfK
MLRTICSTLVLLAAMTVGAGWASGKRSAQPPGEPQAPAALPAFRYDEHLLLPLRVHLLRAKELPEANCALADGDVTRIVGKVNGVWKQAGIQFYLESRVVEEAAGQALFRGLGDRRGENPLLLLRPKESLAAGMFHVFYLHEMGPNGIFLGRDGIFVKETAALRPVAGGIDEPLPRVTAHELGHGLGLPHRQATFNLMASGTTGTLLNADEVATARAAAAKTGWQRAPAALAQLGAEAREERRTGAANDIDRCLAAIPGESELKSAARARLQEGSGAGVVEGVTFARERGSTYVPLRELGEALQCPVRWEARTRTAYLNGQKLARRQTRWLLDGTLLVSLAALKEQGFRITWDAEGKLAAVENGEQSFQVLDPPKRVAVNRATQRLRAWQGHRLVLTTRVSTGRRGYETPRGSFRAGPIKAPLLISRKYSDAKMPWSVQVHGDVLIHGFPSVPPRAASHGCIRMPLSGGNPARWFYDWIDLGTLITVADRWPGAPWERRAGTEGAHEGGKGASDAKVPEK